MKKVVNWCCLIFLTANVCFSQPVIIQKVIDEEFNALRVLSGEPQTRLEIDNTPNMTSEAKTVKGILVFNVPQLVTLTNEIGATYQRDMIRLVIAHELGHQIQYRYLGNSSGLLYECQADIIAGFLMFQRMMAEGGEWQKTTGIHDATHPAYQKKIKEWAERIHAALTVIFREGSNHVLTPSHPTNEERRLALRDGYNYGYVWVFGEFLENDPVMSRSALAPGMRQTCERFKMLLGYLPNDNLVTWSSRHARKIIHSYLPNCKDLVVYTNWNIDSSDVMLKLSFDQLVTNTGNKTITFSFYNQVYSSRRNDPRNTLYWELQATSAHSITLAPNESQSLNGTLQWVTSNDFSPVFTYPGKEGALYAATTLSDKTDVSGDAIRSFFSGDKSQSDENILDAYLSSRDLLASFIGSTGVTYQQASTDQVSYVSRLQIAAAISTHILYDRSTRQYSLEALYYHGDQKSAALRAGEGIMRILTSQKCSMREVQQTGSKERKWEIQDESHAHIGVIIISYSPSFMEYETTLVIYGRR